LKKSFADTRTVSEFLAKRQMMPGSVVIVDEAGQIGGKQMRELLSFVQANGGRVILLATRASTGRSKPRTPCAPSSGMPVWKRRG